MGCEEIVLTEQDYLLLGTIAEQTPNKTRILSLHMYGVAERLVRGGYLEWRVEEAGRIHYDLTDKGRTAWRAHRFPA
jgi:DNA-binding PadR family transcriptional regulator